MDEFDTDGGDESGGSLRQRLEEVVGKLKERDAELLTFKAEKLIQEKGFKHVTPGDLVGVSLKELEKKAAEIEEQNAGREEALLRKILSGKGLADDQLDSIVAGLLDDEKAQDKQASSAITSVIRSGGLPIADRVNDKELSGLDLIAAGLESKAKKAKR
jgi:hypothetical protein